MDIDYDVKLYLIIFLQLKIFSVLSSAEAALPGDMTARQLQWL